MNIPLDLLRLDTAFYPRSALDPGRVAEFMQLFADGGPEALPPGEVVPDGSGGFLAADIAHRAMAAHRLGWTEIPAVVLEVPDGADPIDVAYLRALETAITAAKPLSRAERRTAVVRLVERHPDWPDREIGRRAGVSHQTVGRIRNELANPEARPERTVSSEYLAGISASKVTDQLVRGLSKAWDARGVTDHLLRRMPATLANSLRERFGDEALTWAGRLEQWAADARAELERDAG